MRLRKFNPCHCPCALFFGGISATDARNDGRLNGMTSRHHAVCHGAYGRPRSSRRQSIASRDSYGLG
jgi:hypothetical protein